MVLESAYAGKADAYFTGERHDIVDRLPPNGERAILEIGCGDGTTELIARQSGKCGRYVGIELDPGAAAIAQQRHDDIIVGDIEKLDLAYPDESFDVLIASEVLEHLVDPWKVLARLRPLLRKGALVFASSPNVAHRAIVWMIVRGDWRLADAGPMDRTHLRWFTPRSYAAMFEDCGFDIVSVTPVTPPSAKTRVLNALTGSRLAHLFMDQMMVVARKP